jgi:Domain of unknown function (DUF4390)
MPCLKKILVKCFLLAQLLVGVWAQSPAPTPAAQAVAEISTLTMTRLDKQLGISAQVKFELPAAIEEAMYKGVSLTFVAEVDITRDRWYWTDKTMATSARQIRISYQALTRRWRVLPWSDISSAAGLGG